MKKFVLTVICIILIAPYSLAYYEYTRRMPVLYSDKDSNNIIINLASKKMLLHYSGNCDDALDGTHVTINVRSSLNASGDYLIVNSYRKCLISQAEEIDDIFKVDYKYADNSAIITDEKGYKYYIRYGSGCSGLSAYKDKNLFLRKYGFKLNTGDKIYLPGNQGMCSVSYFEDYKLDQKSEQTEAPATDIQRPTSPSNLTATSGNRSVALNWRAAKDNVGIDHYVISYSKYRLNAKNYSYEEMPNKVKTDSNVTNHVIRNLENAESYFFYVISVDTSGNISSNWSNEATATPRSSIVNWDEKRLPVRILIYRTQETDKHLLFKWNKISSFARQTVSLDVNNVRDFALTDWGSDYMYIYKTPDKKGKLLKFTVRQFDIHGQMFSREFNFSF